MTKDSEHMIDVLSGESCHKVRDVTITFDNWRRTGVILPARYFKSLHYVLRPEAYSDEKRHYAASLCYILDWDAIHADADAVQDMLFKSRDGVPVHWLGIPDLEKLLKKAPPVKSLMLLEAGADITMVYMPSHRFGDTVDI